LPGHSKWLQVTNILLDAATRRF